MKKRHIIYSVLSVLTVFFLSQNMMIVNENEYIDSKNVSNIERENNYLIKLYEGNLNVYDRDNNVVASINVNSDAMREYDRNQFLKGITVQSLDDVKHIAEDFSE